MRYLVSQIKGYSSILKFWESDRSSCRFLSGSNHGFAELAFAGSCRFFLMPLIERFYLEVHIIVNNILQFTVSSAVVHNLLRIFGMDMDPEQALIAHYQD
jgi:hypothetical protein